MPSSKALGYISRFEPISGRAAIKEALERCMLTAFSRYGLELEQIQDMYETNKVRVQSSLSTVHNDVQLWAHYRLTHSSEKSLF